MLPTGPRSQSGRGTPLVREQEPVRDRPGALPEDALRSVNPLLCTLPPGRHGLPREFVKANQRTRLDESLVLALAEVGWRDLSVGEIVKRARVSRRTWYEHFGGKREAVEALLRDAFEHLADEMQALSDPAIALLNLCKQKPALARAMFIEGPIAAPEVYAEGVAGLPDFFSQPTDEERQQAIGGLIWVIQGQMRRGQKVALPEPAAA